jgi:YVTN family beta-propeller protein
MVSLYRWATFTLVAALLFILLSPTGPSSALVPTLHRAPYQLPIPKRPSVVGPLEKGPGDTRLKVPAYGSIGSPSSRAPIRPNAERMPSSTSPPATVVDTLVLMNHTLLPGEAAPPSGGYGPEGLAVDSIDGKVFIGASGGDLAVVNSSSDRLIDVIHLGVGVLSVAYDSANGEVYATHGWYGNYVSVLNASSDQLAATVGVGGIPFGVTVDGQNGEVYVMNDNSSNVSVISGSSNRVTATITVGPEPSYAALDPSNGELYVTDYGSNEVSVINTSSNRVTNTVAAGLAPGGVTFDPTNGEVYVVDCGPGCFLPGGGNGSVTVLDGSNGTLVTGLSVGVCPWGATFDPSTNEVLVADTTCTAPSIGNLSVIDAATNAVAATVPVGVYPYTVAFDPSRDRVYVANSYEWNVTILNDTSWQAVGAVGAGELPEGTVYDPSNGWIYVADWGANDVAVVNGMTGQEVGTLGSWYGPDGLAYDSENGDLYVADSESNNVSVMNVSTDRVVGSIPVGTYPQGIAFDPANGDLYVANCNSGNVTIVDGATDRVVGNPSAGVCPAQAIYDPANGQIYVTNQGPPRQFEYAGDDVTVIQGSTNLVAGSVPVGSAAYGAAYDPADGDVYVANGFSDNLTVINGTSDVPVASIALGPAWGGAQPWGIAYSAARRELLIAFADSDLIGAVNATTNQLLGDARVGQGPWAIAFDPASEHPFVIDSYSGAVSVLNLTLYPPVHEIAFREMGLSSGLSWSVTLNGTTNASTSSTIGFTDPNGTYNFSVANVPGYMLDSSAAGWVSVQGSDVTVTVNFARLWNVTFTEVGLPANTTWSVTFNGSRGVSEGPSVQFSDLNGSYSFSVANVSGYQAQPARGNVTIDGSNVDLVVDFVRLFTLTVTEAGLPTGTTWSVDLNGTLLNSTSPAVSAVLPNGTYPLEIPTAGIYAPTLGQRTVTVHGANLTLSVGFLPLPLQIVSFAVNRSVVPVGGSVTVEVVVGDGVPPLAYAFSGLPPGCRGGNVSTFACTVQRPGHYTLEVTVTDAAGRQTSALVALEVTSSTANHGSSGGPWTGLTGWEDVALIIGAAAAVAVATLLLVRRRRTPRDPRVGAG